MFATKVSHSPVRFDTRSRPESTRTDDEDRRKEQRGAPRHASLTGPLPAPLDTLALLPPHRSPIVKPKLRIGALHDPLETEAYSVADQVTRMGLTNVPWDFSNIPVRFSDRAARPQPLSPSVSASLRGAIQTKLVVGQVDDPLEHEADRVADHVMRMPEPDLSAHASPQQVSRKWAACADGPQALQTSTAKPSETALGEAPSIVHQTLRSHGEPLDPRTRAFFEPRFGRGFSDVRVHVDAEAAESARAVSARAYTVGNDIVFDQNRYGPRSSEGKGLLAHELAHVVQQSGVAGRPGRIQPTVQRNGDAGVRAQQDLHAQLQQKLLEKPPNYDEAALTLNGMSNDKIDEEVRALPQNLKIEVFKGAMRTMLFWPPPQRVVDAISKIDRAAAHQGRIDFFHDSLRGSDWRSAAVVLNGFSDTDIRLVISAPPLTTGQLSAVRAAAIRFMAGWNERVLRPIQDLVATRPDADLAREIGYEAEPSSRPAPIPPPPPPTSGGPPPPPPPPPRVPWDGRTGAPGAAAARTAMQTELFAAFDKYLTFYRPATVTALARPRVALNAPASPPRGSAPAPTGVVDIANQARTVLEAHYATSMDAAAPSTTLTTGRAARTTAPGAKNIFDPSSEADRSAFTSAPDLAPQVAWWIFENDTPGAAGAVGSRRFATEILAAHNYSTEDPGAGQFRWDVANAYANAATLAPNNRRQLIDYRLTGWSERSNSGITLLSSFDPGSDAKRAELVERWEIFRTATHESLHLRTHPAFDAADQGRNTLKEGFPEMFTVDTLNKDVLPRVRNGSLEPLRRIVEGAQSPPAPRAAIITDRVSPTQYAAPRARAERIRDGGTPSGGAAHAGVGEAAVRAAFFEGHVEYLGFAPAGQQLTTLPAKGTLASLRIPPGIAGLDDLARRSGVPRATIQQDNPGITDALPPTAVLAGCREHWVVAGETRALIATQEGVLEAALVRANPDIPADPRTGAWPALAAGQKILVPLQ